ncbi:hypothetical protein D3C72_1942140 [compost metagenome]
MDRLAVAARLHPLADNGFAHAGRVAGHPVGIALGGVDGREALFDKGVENGKARLFVHRPAKDVAAQDQGFDDDLTASERAAVHVLSPLRFAP